jgi:hypothetical protein
VVSSNAGFSQPGLDTGGVILTARVYYINWYGFKDKKNDTTRKLLKIIREKGGYIDSLITMKEKKTNIIYSDELVQEIKNDYFSLQTLVSLQYKDQIGDKRTAIARAIEEYSPTNKESSLIYLFARHAGMDETASALVMQNKRRATGAHWMSPGTPLDQVEYTFQWYKRVIPSYRGAQAKVVTIRSDVDSALVKINGTFKGYTGESYGFWKGSHSTITVEKAPLKACTSTLDIPENDDLSPISIECKIRN